MTTLAFSSPLGALLLLNAALVTVTSAAPIVSAPWGQISGSDVTSPGGRVYSTYLAIPYALPPLGERRFTKPEAHPGPGAGAVHDGSSLGPQCPQELYTEDPTALQPLSEDCLTLNVFAPAGAPPGINKQVMVWIHGGGFVFGGAVGYTPSELVTENDVIVVVIQYRLGILGFLSSGDDDVASGNYGLWDQSLALRWVKDNIRAFGGDPDSVTIFGESAGAASVGFHVLSPQSQGLFTRAVFQSGTPLSSWAINKEPSKEFYDVAKKTRCQATTSWTDSAYYMMLGGGRKAEHQAMLDCLRTVDARTLVPLQGTIDPLGTILWVPTVDGDFVPRDPFELVKDSAYLQRIGATSVDLMLGVNNNEGGYTVIVTTESLDAELVDARLVKNVSYTMLVGEAPDLKKDDRSMNVLLDVIDFFYNFPVVDGKAPAQGLSDVVSDIAFVLPTVDFIQAMAAATSQVPPSSTARRGRSYLYLFNHYPAKYAGSPAGAPKGMLHADDLVYEFDAHQDASRDAFNADDLTIGATFRSMISNFAKSGDPQVTVGQQGGAWPQFSMETQSYLSLEPVPRVATRLYAKRVALWTSLLPALYNSTAPTRPQSPYVVHTNPNYQQQQNQQPFGGNGQTFTFTGRLTFYKLH